MLLQQNTWVQLPSSTWWNTTIYNYSSGKSNDLFWSLRALDSHVIYLCKFTWSIHTCTNKYICFNVHKCICMITSIFSYYINMYTSSYPGCQYLLNVSKIVLYCLVLHFPSLRKTSYSQWHFDIAMCVEMGLYHCLITKKHNCHQQLDLLRWSTQDEKGLEESVRISMQKSPCAARSQILVLIGGAHNSLKRISIWGVFLFLWLKVFC